MPNRRTPCIRLKPSVAFSRAARRAAQRYSCSTPKRSLTPTPVEKDHFDRRVASLELSEDGKQLLFLRRADDRQVAVTLRDEPRAIACRLPGSLPGDMLRCRQRSRGV